MSSEGFPGLVSRRLNEHSAICPIAIDLRCTILHTPALVHPRMQTAHTSHRWHRTSPSGVLRRSMLALRHSTSACGLHVPLSGQGQTKGTMQHCPKKKKPPLPEPPRPTSTVTARPSRDHLQLQCTNRFASAPFQSTPAGSTTTRLIRLYSRGSISNRIDHSIRVAPTQKTMHNGHISLGTCPQTFAQCAPLRIVVYRVCQHSQTDSNIESVSQRRPRGGSDTRVTTTHPTAANSHPHMGTAAAVGGLEPKHA